MHGQRCRRALCPVGEGAAAAPVDMQVHEAGGQQAVPELLDDRTPLDAGRSVLGDGRDPIPTQDDPGLADRPVGQDDGRGVEDALGHADESAPSRREAAA